MPAGLFKFVLICLAHIFALAAMGAQAVQPVQIATFQIPLMVESADKGLFVDLTREISRRAKVPIKINVYPTARTLIDFSNSKVDSFFPALDVYTPKNAVKTVTFYTKVDFIFYRQENPLKNLADLEGKRIGLTFRYPYVKALTDNKKIKIEYADDDVSNMKKLGAGLIDGFVVEERSGLQALKLSKEKGITYNAKKALSKQAVYYAFQNREQGRELARKFNIVIEEMIKDGSIEKLLSNPTSPLSN